MVTVHSSRLRSRHRGPRPSESRTPVYARNTTNERRPGRVAAMSLEHFPVGKRSGLRAWLGLWPLLRCDALNGALSSSTYRPIARETCPRTSAPRRPARGVFTGFADTTAQKRLDRGDRLAPSDPGVQDNRDPGRRFGYRFVVFRRQSASEATVTPEPQVPPANPAPPEAPHESVLPPLQGSGGRAFALAWPDPWRMAVAAVAAVAFIWAVTGYAHVVTEKGEQALQDWFHSAPPRLPSPRAV
jgi:hypothetical protein